MHGKNPARKQQLDLPHLWIQEIFPTIQGEGPATGRPATFIRLAGCNLKCYFCDTDFESGELYLTPKEVLARVEAAEGEQKALVVLSGGEPLRQNVVPLIDLLVRTGRVVHIETAGTLWVDGLQLHFLRGKEAGPRSNTIVCSPKVTAIHKKLLPLIGAWKYIVDVQDGVGPLGFPAMSTQQEGRTAPSPAHPPDGFPPEHIYIQPCDWGESARSAANMTFAAEVAMQYGYTLSLQTHKLLGLP